MSNQIEDLIANIQQKFDDEFRTEPDSSSISKIQDEPKNNKQTNQNPQSFQSSPNVAPEIKSQNQLKHEIVIEEDHENEESSQVQHEVKNQKRKLDYGEEVENKEEGEQEDENKYRDLSNKLQTALKKISSSKKQFATYHPTTNSSDYLNRFQDYQRKKQRDLQAKRKQQQQKKYHGIKSKPDINKKSQQIAEQTSYKPIYQRFDQILQQKKKKMQSNVQNKKALEQEEYQKFMEEYKKHAKIQPDNCRDINTYFNDMMAWKSKLDKEREQKLKQKQIKQKEGYTFKPELNKRSERLIKNQKRVPIQERQIQRPKTEQSEYTFKPKINKRKVP